MMLGLFLVFVKTFKANFLRGRGGGGHVPPRPPPGSAPDNYTNIATRS